MNELEGIPTGDSATADDRIPSWLFAVLGAVTTVVAGLVLATYRRNSGSSNATILVATVIVAVLPLVTLWFRAGPRRMALLAEWAGSCAMLFVAAGAMGGGALAGAAMTLYAFLATGALLVGGLCQALLEEGLRFLLRRAQIRREKLSRVKSLDP